MPPMAARRATGRSIRASRAAICMFYIFFLSVWVQTLSNASEKAS